MRGKWGLCLLALLVFSASASAQTAATSVITGTVTDERGAKIPGAHVTLTSDANIRLSRVADQSGSFEFKNLRAGSYLVEIKAKGFSEFASEQIRLGRGESRMLPVELKIASVNASVIVTATGTAQRDDEVSKVVSTLDAQEIEAKAGELVQAVKAL